MSTRVPLLRSLELEEVILHEACRGYVDPDRLLRHARTRADTLSGESDCLLKLP